MTRTGNIRADILRMSASGKDGHLMGALSCVEILLAAYDWMKPEDRLIFSKGHACKALYAVMADKGIIPYELLAMYGQPDSPLQSHPCALSLGGLHASSGSLGMGLGQAAGRAFGARDRRVVAILSDGDCNEGSTWESAMFAAARGLKNLVAIVDANSLQAVARTDEVVGDSMWAAKFVAFGWRTVEVDGHDLTALAIALSTMQPFIPKPTAIIAHTTPGKGISFMENKIEWHYRSPTEQELGIALAELETQ
jgi:transketolase